MQSNWKDFSVYVLFYPVFSPRGLGWHTLFGCCSYGLIRDKWSNSFKSSSSFLHTCISDCTLCIYTALGIYFPSITEAQTVVLQILEKENKQFKKSRNLTYLASFLFAVEEAAVPSVSCSFGCSYIMRIWSLKSHNWGAVNLEGQH